jgi:hypothetical protein
MYYTYKYNIYIHIYVCVIIRMAYISVCVCGGGGTLLIDLFWYVLVYICLAVTRLVCGKFSLGGLKATP